MASHSNPGPAEDDAERGGVGGVWPRDTSYSTRVARDITYKAIPFCAFCLVVFSAGGILVSTLAFDKPLPHQAAIVISSILLSFFVLFCIGSMYIYFRKFQPHVSKDSNSPGVSRQRSHSGFRLWGSAKGATRRFMGLFSGNISYNGETDNRAAPRSVEGGQIRTDTLRDPAPSPDRLRRETRQQGDVSHRQDTVYELEEPARQSTPQQWRPQADRGGRPSQQGSPGIDQIPSRRGGNGPMPTYTAYTPPPNQTYSHPNSRHTQEDPTRLSPRRNPAQSPSLVRNQYHVAGPREYVRNPTQQQRIRERSRDVHVQGYSGPIPTIRIEAPAEPPLPPLPDATGMRLRQVQDPAIGGHTENTTLPRSRTESSERWPRDYLDNDPSLAHAPVAVSQRLTSDKADGQVAVPVNGSLSSIQAISKVGTRNSKHRRQPQYIEHDITEYVAVLQSLPLPKAVGDCKR
ncbi:hypothetical protein F5Y10DRAFT_288334 [Nemania abortiva]|nr:hypothetical protein F5Y10DRAFT_288334 [Nemania abortiva]